MENEKTEQERFQYCQGCHETVPVRLELMQSGQHHAKRLGLNCNHFLGWERKPDADRKTRPAASRNLVQKLGGEYCQMCLRWAGELPKGQTLEAHHVIPHSEKEAVEFGFAEAGDDSEKNTWIVCTACHRLIDWRRDYRDVREIGDGT